MKNLSGSTSFDHCFSAAPIQAIGSRKLCVQKMMSGRLKKALLEHRLLLIVLLLGACQILLFIALCLPYRYFPSDDWAYYKYLTGGQGQMPSLVFHPVTYRYVHPIYGCYLVLCNSFWSWWAPTSPSVLIFSNLLANMVSMAMLVITCRRITGSLGWATAAGLIFITSAWTANYYFFFFANPFSVALAITAFCLMVMDAFSEKKPHSRLIPFGCGLLLAMAFWSSPSAAVSVFLVLLVSPFIYGLQDTARRRVYFRCYWLAIGFVLLFAFYAFISSPAYLSHIYDNVTTNAYQEALTKFGISVLPPFFSFFRVLSVYSPIEFMLFLTLVALITFYFFKQDHRSDKRLRLCLILAGYCLAHSLIIDLLPTTKLGRTLFHGYPFWVMFLAVGGQWAVSQRITFASPQRFIAGIIPVLLAINLFYSITQDIKTRETRFSVPEFVDVNQQYTKIYLLLEDPHSDFIRMWLNDSRVSMINAEELEKMVLSETLAGRHSMVILGPSGPGSGNSILRSASIPDYNPEIPDLIAGKHISLPYYAFHPFFLFEEETCQSLYFTEGDFFPPSSSTMIKIFLL